MLNIKDLFNNDYFKDLKVDVLSAICSGIIGTLDKSYRFKKINYKPELSPVIYAVWHGWQYGILSVKKERGNIHLLVSKSRDGEFIGRISTNIGYKLIRGSKGIDGTKALREIIKVLKNGGNIMYTVDGSRGPIFKVKPGIIKIAQMAQVPIVPLVPEAKWKTNANSWDKYQIPYLFTPSVVVFGDPIHIPKDLDDNKIEYYRELLEVKLFELQKDAQKYLYKQSN